ncbi:MAG: hypothetical protein LBT06_19455 [Hungatella sp.]|nr:hypothetical protein [Hungatella sp.]
MKDKYFIITFSSNKTVFATAFNETEAVILAQAVMIKNGLVYEVKDARETNCISDMTKTNFCV